MQKILILEDDAVASSTLKRRLEFEGYEVDCFDKSEEVLLACDKKNYNLLILDVTIHNSLIDGVEVASHIRKKHTMPFIFVTSSRSEEGYIRGLSEGAIAYIPKPISYKVLVIQINNILKAASVNKPILYKDYTFDLVRNTIKKGDKIIRLSQKPMECIVYLIKNYGRVVSKQELSQEIWPGEIPVSDDVINITITRIRKELGENIILTYRGRGYEIQP